VNVATLRARLTDDPKLVLVVAGAFVLTLALAVWFLAISPKHSRASDLESQIAVEQGKLAVQRSASGGPAARLSPAEIRQLARAVPNGPNVAALVRELNRLAKIADVTLDTVTLDPSGTTTGAAVPLTVVVDGRFLAVRGFMRLVRMRVRVDGRKVTAKGRLYDVQAVDFQQSSDPRPNVRATLTMQAFVAGSTTVPTGGTETTATVTTTASGH
jgi:hypothetical protein